MKLAFVLGRIAGLAIAEVEAVLNREEIGYKIEKVSQQILLLDIDSEREDLFSFLMDQLGGTIKIVEMGEEAVENRELEIVEAGKKMNIGVSGYSLGEFWGRKERERKRKELTEWSFDKKKELRKQKVGVRVVTIPFRQTDLSSVVVEGNEMLEKGVEYVKLYDGKKELVGITRMVQDFEGFSQRDYQRPNRDAKIGMTPPKLCRIMLNLAGVEKRGRILDPFCGLGTFITEGALLNYNMIGSDISKDLVEASERNFKWFFRGKKKAEFLTGNAVNMGRRLQNGSLGAVVTEGTLGPPYTGLPSKGEIQANFEDLDGLYQDVFRGLKKALKPGGKVVITLPCYLGNKGEKVYYPFIDKIDKLGYSRQSLLSAEIGEEFGQSDRQTIVYSRPKQVVGREVAIFVSK